MARVLQAVSARRCIFDEPISAAFRHEAVAGSPAAARAGNHRGIEHNLDVIIKLPTGLSIFSTRGRGRNRLWGNPETVALSKARTLVLPNSHAET